MTDRGIILRSSFIAAARAGRRTHVFMPATYVPGQRTGLSPEERARQAANGLPATRYSTMWARLQPGDRLFVQEEISALVDAHHSEVAQYFYVLDLPSGRVPIPGGVRAGKWRTVDYPANKCTREASRYTLEVKAVRACQAHDMTWEEMKREGTFDAHTTLGAWWGHQYGILMPWSENHAVIGVDFTFTDGNIDTGERWAPTTQATNPFAVRTSEHMAGLFGTRAVKDD